MKRPTNSEYSQLFTQLNISEFSLIKLQKEIRLFSLMAGKTRYGFGTKPVPFRQRDTPANWFENLFSIALI